MGRIEIIGGTPRSVSTLYCVGRNYTAHAQELGNDVPDQPVIFLKARSALRPLSSGPLAFPSETFHHELELVLLIDRGAALGSQVGWDEVGAVAVGIDLTRRQVQHRCKERRLPWTPAKSFAGSALVSPFVPRARLGNPVGALRFTLTVLGELRQQGDTTQMIFDVPTLLTYLASLAPLEAGDLVYTGTPEGVGPITAGDAFQVSLESGSYRTNYDGRL